MKKSILFAIGLLGLLYLFPSCSEFSDDDDLYIDIPIDSLPDNIIPFLQENYGGYSIRHAELEDLCDSTLVYELELEDGPGPDVDLVFNLQGEFLFAAMEILLADLPEAVLNSIESNFSGYSIDEDDIEQFELADGSIQYEVELDADNDSDRDIDVVFDENGEIVCQEEESDDDDGRDDDGDDDCDEIDFENVPDSVLTFINSNFQGYSIDDDVECETLCDSTLVYEIELEDGPNDDDDDVELYFDLDWNFLFSAREISVNDLPEEILNAIRTQFPGYTIEDDDTERFELADGSIQYLVELEPESGSDMNVIFDTEGSVYCQEQA